MEPSWAGLYGPGMYRFFAVDFHHLHLLYLGAANSALRVMIDWWTRAGPFVVLK